MSKRLRDRVARRAAMTLLRGIEHGRLTVVEDERTYGFGPAGSDLVARFEVKDARAGE